MKSYDEKTRTITHSQSTQQVELIELIDPLLPVFDTSSLVRMSLTCRLFRNAISAELICRKKNELMRRVVCGEETAAKAILDLSPSLLKEKGGKATDYSGKKIKGLTPFQAALCAGDVDMCNMMKKFFLANPEQTGGQDEMIRQFKQILPDAEGGLAGHLERQKQNTFDFTPIVTAIKRAAPAELTAALGRAGARFKETEEARAKSNEELTLTESLNRFREQFTQISHNQNVYNPQHLLRAFNVYVEQFNLWGRNEHKLFWCQVLGFVQRFLPACDAQAFAQGILLLTIKKGTLQRSFHYKSKGGRFYPLDLTSYFGLGFEYAATGDGLWNDCSFGSHPQQVAAFFESHLQNLSEAKRLSLENICRSNQHPQPSA